MKIKFLDLINPQTLTAFTRTCESTKNLWSCTMAWLKRLLRGVSFFLEQILITVCFEHWNVHVLCDKSSQSTFSSYSTKHPYLADVIIELIPECPVPLVWCDAASKVQRSVTHLQSVDQSRAWPFFSIFSSSVYTHTLSTLWIWSQSPAATKLGGKKWKLTSFTASSEREKGRSGTACVFHFTVRGHATWMME